MKTLALLFALTLSCLAQPLSPNDPAFLQSTSPLRRGLVGYWRLEEASGTRYDYSSTGCHLTSVNSVARDTGKVGYAATFVSASQQKLNASSSNLLQFGISSPITISGWINSTNNGVVQWVFGKLDAVNVIGYQVWINSPSGTVQWHLLSSVSKVRLIFGTSNVTGAGWKHVACTYDGSGSTNGMRLYIDNISEFGPSSASTGVMTDILNTDMFSIGERVSSNGYEFNGAIDEVGVWNRVLTAAELTQLYNAGVGTHFPWAHP